MLKLNNKQKNTLTAVAILAIGLVVVFIPTLLKNEKLRNFTTNKFNFVLLVVIGVVLAMLNMRVGIVYAVLLLSILSYSQLNGFMSPLTCDANTSYEGQFVMPLKQVNTGLDDDNNYVNKYGVETFTSCSCGNTPCTCNGIKSSSCNCGDVCTCGNRTQSESFSSYRDKDLISTDTETFENTQTAQTPTDLTTFYNNLEKESLTTQLKNTNFNFDAVSCRYDSVNAHQNVSLNGPPLGWNATYDGENVNGQLFYPLHG